MSTKNFLKLNGKAQLAQDATRNTIAESKNNLRHMSQNKAYFDEKAYSPRNI